MHIVIHIILHALCFVKIKNDSHFASFSRVFTQKLSEEISNENVIITFAIDHQNHSNDYHYIKNLIFYQKHCNFGKNSLKCGLWGDGCEICKFVLNPVLLQSSPSESRQFCNCSRHLTDDATDPAVAAVASLLLLLAWKPISFSARILWRRKRSQRCFPVSLPRFREVSLLFPSSHDTFLRFMFHTLFVIAPCTDN
jgi:hypothetical protein